MSGGSHRRRDQGPDSAAPEIGRHLLVELFGEDVESTSPMRWYRSLPIERRQLGLILIVSALMFLPMLGAVGLWDPWEAHYAEVGREMLVRRDWIFPWWEKYPFFSKPPLTMWLTNLGLLLSGAGATVSGQEMGRWAEWGIRLPIALLAIAAVGMLYLAGARIFGRRIGLLAAFACLTMPLYDLLARQAITDTPFVALLTIGLCCFAIAEFDPGVTHRDLWLFSFYGAIGLSTLAKEIPFGFGLPGAVVLAYLVLTGDWALLRRVRLFWGGLLALAIAAPWVVWMSFTHQVDEEGYTFLRRYWLHDNFDRLLAGVHTTSPNAPFTYYIQQLGYGMFPWSALLPGGLTQVAIDPAKREDRAKLFVALWALVPFAVVSLSATKFEHYAFPCLPPLALLTALYLDRLWRDGLRPHAGSLLLGGVLFAMIGQDLHEHPKLLTEMFTYNPERPYPAHLVADPAPVLAALLLAGGLVALLGFLRRGKAVGWGALALGLGIALYCSTHLGPHGWEANPSAQWAPRDVMGGIFGLSGCLGLLAAFRARPAWFIAAFAGCALSFGGYLSWVHWEQLSPHWTQRGILHTYYAERRPPEPLGAFEMNWKGETFYSKNEVRQLPDPRKLVEFLRTPVDGGGRHWVIVDARPEYWRAFQQIVGGEGKRFEVRDDSSVKFFLVTVD